MTARETYHRILWVMAYTTETEGGAVLIQDWLDE
jgi:hypothetical protein